MNPKQRLLEIYAALPESTRSIAGAVKEMFRQIDILGWGVEDTENAVIQIAEAAWQIGAERRARLEITDSEFWKGEAESGYRRIRDLESREVGKEPVAWISDTGILRWNPTRSSVSIPLYRLRKSPAPIVTPAVNPTTPPADGTSPSHSIQVPGGESVFDRVM